MTGESWVYFDKELTRYWNYFSDKEAALTNTRLLFQLASRAHFNFFMSKVNYLVPSEDTSIDDITDSEYEKFFVQNKKKIRSVSELKAQSERWTGGATILLTSKHLKLKNFPNIKTLKILEVDDSDLLLNIEPAWRSLREKLSSHLFTNCLVSLGPIRGVVIPRLAYAYNARVIDISFLAEPKDIKEEATMFKKFQTEIRRRLPF